MLNLYDLKTEYRKNPLGIDLESPRFSWKLKSDQKDTVQRSYQIVVKSEAETVWDTGKIESDQSICIPYQGKAFRKGTRYTVQVNVEDNHGDTAVESTWFETGLMGYQNFAASWITHGFEDGLEPCAVFVKKFYTEKQVKSARIYASALGIYELELNGGKVGDAYFAPGWTSYQKRIQYQTYDVTEQLKNENEIRMTVGNGWYKGILGFYNQGDHYGKRTAVIAQIEILYTDGSREQIVTDESWMSTTGARRYSEIYHGEVIDYSRENEELRPVQLYDQAKEVLTAQEDEPVRITEQIPAKELIVTPKGEVVIDFGQNLTGVVKAHLKYPKGTKVTIRHAEALDENGNFYTVNLRTAKAEDTFICSGKEDVFMPIFTFHGFRYIQILGLEELPGPEDFTACVIHTALEQTGEFSCSNDLVNRLWKNIDWTMRSNYLDIPTDCPQRDERLGYTGDAQMFISTAACHKNIALFFQKWLRDLKYEQSLGMGVPTSVPNILGPSGGIAIWHDAATVVPWTMYQVYGDIRFLEEQFDSMVSCVEYTKNTAGEDGLIHTGQQLGDWIAMDMDRGPYIPREGDVWNLELNEKTGSTDLYYIANIYYAYSAYITAQSAKILGKEAEYRRYQELYESLTARIRSEYMTSTGRLVSETQTGCAMALHFGLAQGKERERVLDTLLKNLKTHKNHLTTGFVGTQFLCKVLSENGAHETAGSVFLKEDCPSWLYSVRLGATTVWELWDGVKPDGSFNKYEMNSLNQYALASIGDWIFHDLCGLKMIEPGYQKSMVKPRLIKGIPEMKGEIETVYGKLSCEISCMDHKYTIDISVPENTTAVISLPEKEEFTAGSGHYHYEYETESSFVKEKYDMESKFGEILENPIAHQMLTQYAPELMANEMFLQFAMEHTLNDMNEMLPPEAMQLMQMILAQCNAAEKGD